ncbi:MAG: hypothetical protein WAJ87_17065 [Bryobacteraceae bacterium]
MNRNHLVPKTVCWMDWIPCFRKESELLHPLAFFLSLPALHHVAEDLDRCAGGNCRSSIQRVTLISE